MGRAHNPKCTNQVVACQRKIAPDGLWRNFGRPGRHPQRMNDYIVIRLTKSEYLRMRVFLAICSTCGQNLSDLLTRASERRSRAARGRASQAEPRRRR